VNENPIPRLEPRQGIGQGQNLLPALRGVVARGRLHQDRTLPDWVNRQDVPKPEGIHAGLGEGIELLHDASDIAGLAQTGKRPGRRAHPCASSLASSAGSDVVGVGWIIDLP